MGQLLAMKSLLQSQAQNVQQQEATALQIAKHKRDVQTEEAAKQLFGGATKPTEAEIMATLGPTHGIPILTAQRAAQRAETEQQLSRLNLVTEQTKRGGQILATATDQKTYEDAVRRLVPVLGAAAVQEHFPATYDKALVDNFTLSSLDVEKQADLKRKAIKDQWDADEQKHQVAMRPFQQRTAELGATKAGQEVTGTQPLNEFQRRSLENQERIKDVVSLASMLHDPKSTPEQKEFAKKTLATLTAQTIAGRPQVNVSGPGMATEDDYKAEGAIYARTGIMPSLGTGSGAGRSKILHYAHAWAREKGLKPDELVSMRAAYAGDKASLLAFTKQFDQIKSFEQTASKNLDLFLSLAEKIPDTGVPWLNIPLRLLNEKLVGADNMAAVNTARNVANNEIAKVTSGGGLGGVLSDSARHEVAEYNPKEATFAQTKKVAGILKIDMANRIGAMTEAKADIMNRLGGGEPAGGHTPAAVTDVKTWDEKTRSFR